MTHGPGPRLLAELSFGAATRSSAPDLASLPRWAPALPHVSQLRTSPPCRGGLWRCHVAPALPPREESSGAATYLTVPSGLWTTGIKKGLAGPSTQLGSHVSKAWSRVTEAPVRRADMPLQFGSTEQRRPSSPLLDMATVVIRPDRTVPQR
jgi:hypothetical protein